MVAQQKAQQGLCHFRISKQVVTLVLLPVLQQYWQRKKKVPQLESCFLPIVAIRASRTLPI
jgi:hypothetical protein